MSDPQKPDERASSVRWRIFALACGTSLLLYLHRYTWNIVGPKLQDEYHFTNFEAGLLFSAFYYTYAGGQIPSGLIIDRFGPHRFLSISILAWSLALAAMGQTSLIGLLYAARLLFGAAQAGCYPALTQVTRSWFPSARRTVLQGWIATTFGRGGGALAPIILGTLLMGWCGLSWQSSLLILGLAGACYALVFFLAFRNSPAEHPGANNAERSLIGTHTPPPDASGRTYLPPQQALQSRDIRIFVLQQFLDAGSDVVFVSLIGTYFLNARGFDIAKTGLLASLPLWGGALGGIAGGWLNDQLIARTKSRRWPRSGVGFAGKLLGCAVLLLVVRQTDGVTAAWLLMAAKFFSDWSQPTVWGTCTDLGGRFSATLFSIINTSGTLGGVVMPLFFGSVLDAFTTQTKIAESVLVTTNWAPLFTILSAMYLASGICWLWIDCTRSLDATPIDPAPST